MDSTPSGIQVPLFYKKTQKESFMRKKVLGLVAFLSLALLGNLNAQDNNVAESVAPQKGDIMLSINFGISPFIGGDLRMPEGPDGSSYGLSAPMSNWFDSKPQLSIEGRYFLTEKWSLKATGGFGYNYNPGYSEIPSVEHNGETSVPGYDAVPKTENIQWNIGLGGDYHFLNLTDRLLVRGGGEVGFAYGLAKANYNSETTMGRSVSEAYAWRIAAVAGVDYFIGNSVFVGMEVRPLTYQYSVYSIRPQAGLGTLSSDNHKFGFLAQPMIKFGFKF